VKLYVVWINRLNSPPEVDSYWLYEGNANIRAAKIREQHRYDSTLDVEVQPEETED
jgi:hypothetical protein